MNLDKVFWRTNIVKSLRSYSKINIPRQKRIRSRIDMDLKSREDPVVLKLDTPEFQNIFNQEVIELKKLFDKYNYEIRIAGGAVRDLLLGQQAKDLDFATTATPQEMKEMFTAENVRMINMAGEKHGTVTPRINDKENFEVTTLRIDMVTDGRHAEVEFTKDWKLDANRRDLTINSMFLGFDGLVYDYFYGYEDLQKRRIAFVGDADVRIKEDYLRIMRYFRFYGRIAESANNHDQHTIDVIKQNADGLTNVSGERIWMELKKTLQGNFSGDLLKKMLEVNIGPYIGLPNPNIKELDKLLKRSKHLDLQPMSYLAALLNNIDDATLLHARLKFSNYDRDMTYFIIENRDSDDESAPRPLLPYEKIVLNTKIKQQDAYDYVVELLKYRGDEKLLEDFKKWIIPRFPVNGKILKENGYMPGKMYSHIIYKLKDMWIESEYQLGIDDLVKLIPSIVDKNKIK
ncbi:CCA tRNA nucleotidyltransferase 1, mitochondrial isoform X1 [Nymphalis io]|uniref:CCA tRNA nucleotidyltransferase 1, mitochondrial isoform X1 n=2 Tax=Inachis io TaxID=171585 RepID=UPI002169AA3E|nr:CCA tRNA nucleotidyltransferase 1, mitochondrial isoform X1 [Nymphalis io]XP_050354038.1 CCA tRNA nucleotidyltransferase 1, mitochondrial isoform X1 [Nymphalis io]XP_050354039.1 CCA tRNA nucleotidyltransferase 1, mitochondrial isoform X1 [Nymphalis io]